MKAPSTSCKGSMPESDDQPAQGSATGMVPQRGVCTSGWNQMNLSTDVRGGKYIAACQHPLLC